MGGCEVETVFDLLRVILRRRSRGDQAINRENNERTGGKKTVY